MSAERADVEAARTEAERAMQLGRPVAHSTVHTLLSGLHQADAEMVRLRADRDRWQEAYCEARLEARRILRKPMDPSVRT